ncbi:MAG: DUF192 domain-containing protein [Phycisphaerae bacterium]|nr:DUF192 domain-containing protein [Phycisphaerae bacterium]
MRFAVKSAVCLVIFLGAVAPRGCRRSRPARPRVTINQRSWQVELATTPQQHRRGLAGRSQISPEEGMLFVFPRAKPLRFWMKGCLVDLDIAFIGPDMRVVAVRTMRAGADRGNYVTYSSVHPAQYALEVRAGGLAAAGVRTGHSAQFSAEIPSAAKAAADP